MTSIQPLFLTICLFILPVLFLKVHRRSLESPGRKDTDILLLKSPNKFDVLDIIYLILSLLAKYILSAVGLTLSLVPSREEPQQFSLPQIRLSGLLNVDNADIARFNTAIKTSPSNSGEPSTLNPLFLSALTGPLVIYILALPACPIKPLGAVNTRNKITLLSPNGRSTPLVAQDCAKLLESSKAGNLSYHASFGGRAAGGKRTKRGVDFMVRIEVLHESQVIMIQELTYLQFLPRETIPHFSTATTVAIADAGPTKEELDTLVRCQELGRTLEISTRDPRRWAACNKDYNPIHISGLAAKLFGQSGVIAHGMHVVAMALEQASNQSNGSVKARPSVLPLDWTAGFDVEMTFLKPIKLPASLQCRGSVSQRGTERRLVIVGGDKVYTFIRCANAEE